MDRLIDPSLPPSISCDRQRVVKSQADTLSQAKQATHFVGKSNKEAARSMQHNIYHAGQGVICVLPKPKPVY